MTVLNNETINGCSMLQSLNVDVLPVPDGQTLRATRSEDRVTVALDGQPLMQFRLSMTALGLAVSVLEYDASDLRQAVWAASYWLFANYPECFKLVWLGLETTPNLLRSGLVAPSSTADDSLQSSRTQFWQTAGPWTRGETSAGYPQEIVMHNGVRFPQRPPKPAGEVYRRYDARLGSWVSLRTLDVDADLERFNRWQNTPRVEEFWEEGGSLDEHRAHLQTLAADPHCLQLIGCFDDEPFGFFDAYWAREDRIGPYYESDHYDRGIHMLVGEDHHRGPHKVASWLPALVHYLFLDEPRTRTIVSEPRSDNDRMINHLQRVGFHRQKDFDFPHKRAAMMALTRECFFDRCTLC